MSSKNLKSEVKPAEAQPAAPSGPPPNPGKQMMIFAAIVGIISPFVIRGGACALSDVSPQLSAALPWAPAPVLIAAHRFLYDTSALFSFGCFLLLLSAFIANLGGMFITNMEGITNANKLPKARIKGALEKEFPVLQFMVHKVAITAHMVYRLWLIGGGGPVRVLTGLVFSFLVAPIAPSAGNLAAEEKAPTLALAPFKIITLLPAELPGLHYALALFEATPSEVPSFLTSAPAWAKSLWGQLVLNPTWDTVLPWAVLSVGAVVWLNAVKNAGSMDHLVDFPESNSLRKPFLGLVILLVKALALLPAFLLVVPGDMTVKLSAYCMLFIVYIVASQGKAPSSRPKQKAK